MISDIRDNHAASTCDQRSPGNPSRTTIEDTVIDLCSEVGQRGVLELVTKAVQTRRTTAARLLALLDGDVTLRYGWDDVTQRACLVAVEVATILAARGWSDLPHACPLCRAHHQAAG